MPVGLHTWSEAFCAETKDLCIRTFVPWLSELLIVVDEQFSDVCAEGSHISCMSVATGGSELAPFAEDPLSPGVLCSGAEFVLSATVAEFSV